MKFIKLYESFKDIDSMCKRHDIKNYNINKDGTVDVDSNVDFSYRNLTKLPLKFGKISGHFDCRYNKLTSLKGCPQSVGGDFIYHGNKLTTLEEGPRSVGGGFDCSYNELISLKGCPKSVGGYFNCSDNKLTKLEGCPQSVGGAFYCRYNELNCLYGFPEFFDNDIYYYNNPVDEILKLFNISILGKIIDLLNEYGVIQQDGKLVILDRLEEVFYTLNMEIPKEINLKNYEVY